MIVVHAAQEGNAEVTHVEITSPTVLEQEQVIDNKLVESVDLVEEGESLVVSCEGQSSLLSW